MELQKPPAIEAELCVSTERFRDSRDLKTYIELDVQFHRIRLEASGLKPLLDFSDLLNVFFQRIRDSVN